MVFRHAFVAIFVIVASMFFLRDWNIRAQEHELKPIPQDSIKSEKCGSVKITEQEMECLIDRASDSSYGFIEMKDVKKCLKTRFEQD